MLKLKIALVILLAMVYYLATYCILSPGICRYYADYYIFYDRSFSIDEERAFEKRFPDEKVKYFRNYKLALSLDTFNVIGASTEETNKLWSNGNTARISFELPQVYSDVELDFDVSAYTNSKNESVDVEVYLGDKLMDRWHFKYGRKHPDTKFKISQKYLESNRLTHLIFKIEGIASPQSLGYGSETKKFGLIFNKLRIVPQSS